MPTAFVARERVPSFRFDLLVAERASYLAERGEVKALKEASREEIATADLALMSGLDELLVIRDAAPEAWDGLLGAAGVSEEGIVYFRAFQLMLGSAARRSWFTRDQILDAWSSFIAHEKLLIDESEFDALLALFACTPEEATSWGTTTFLVQVGDWFAYWFFGYHVLHPDLALLTLLMKKHPQVWDRTLGTELGRVASEIARQLPTVPGLHVASERKKKSLGTEIDLALFDETRSVLLVCELKAVFDRFRTNFQLSNFLEQRVNFPRAIRQARDAAAAVTSGQWRLAEIFPGQPVPPTPARVVPVVVTWWDIVNPTLGSDDEIVCLNFRSLVHLVAEANGDLAEVEQAASELAHVYCPAYLHEGGVQDELEEIEFVREVQSDVLPPWEMIINVLRSPLALREVGALRRLPDARSTEVKETEAPPPMFFYPPDTRP